MWRTWVAIGEETRQIYLRICSSEGVPPEEEREAAARMAAAVERCARYERPLRAAAAAVDDMWGCLPPEERAALIERAGATPIPGVAQCSCDGVTLSQRILISTHLLGMVVAHVMMCEEQP